MRFRTEMSPVRAPFTLNPERPVALVGSCFASNMAERMRGCLWRAVNPLGVLYNPVSVARVLRAVMAGDAEAHVAASVFCGRDGMWHSWLFDSAVSGRSRETVVREATEALRRMRDALDRAGALFVTFGTAICYSLANAPDYIVGNCHKQPAAIFSRHRLDVDEIAGMWTDLCRDLHGRWPQLRIVFTVSPVRHVKDGFVENSRSKATLLLAVERICGALGYCSYFPAYELLNDDLRDYRFYARDLAHPSEEAIDYIWEFLRATYVDAAGEAMLREGEAIRRATSHRPNIPLRTEADRAAEDARLRDVRLRYDRFAATHGPDILPLDITMHI